MNSSLVSISLPRRLAYPPVPARLAAGLAILTAIIAVAIWPGLVTPMDPYAQDLVARLEPPAWYPDGAWRHPFGTDEFGRDVLARVIGGTRISLTVGVSAILLSGGVGIPLGMTVGYKRGVSEALLLRLIDGQIGFPPVLLTILIVSVAGASVQNVILVLAITGWVTFARVVYNETRSLREREFVEAARAIGASFGRVLYRHILPNLATTIVVLTSIQVGRMILLEGGLDFLGLGVPPPAPSWGGMLAEGLERVWVAPWLSILPGVALTVTVLAINILAEGARELLDPRAK